MAHDTGDFELGPTEKTWGSAEIIETRSEDSWSNTVIIEVDSSMPAKYELVETDARVPNVGNSDLEAGKRAMAEMARTGMSSGTVVVHPISRVREQVRDVDRFSYTPQSVPIGPYHVGCSSPRIEKEKLCCVGFLQSLSEQRTGCGLTGLAEQLEPLARECYPGGVGHMKPEEMSTMLLRDGCYLLTCTVNYMDVLEAAANNNNANKLAHNNSGGSKDDDDTVAQTAGGGDDDVQDGGSSTGGDDTMVVRDTVFLAENQIPFFVLEKIHERVTGDTTSSVLEHVAVYVQKQLQVQLYISKNRRPAPPSPTSHLLHLLHAYLQPTSVPQAAKERVCRTGRWRRVTEYCKYMRFKRRVFKDDEDWTFLDVRLQGGTLWVPRLQIDGMTWTVLRNLMALEEQLSRRPVTAYCVFMSQVACKEEDVKLLVDSGILEHFLASDEHVAQAFTDLCRGVVFDVNNPERNYLKPMWHEMQEYCENPVHRFMGWFCQFRHIGAIIALLVALIVTACQVTQTFYAVSSTRGGQ